MNLLFMFGIRLATNYNYHLSLVSLQCPFPEGEIEDDEEEEEEHYQKEVLSSPSERVVVVVIVLHSAAAVEE